MFNLLTQEDDNDQTISFEHDELNRLELKTYSTSDPTVEYIYDNETIPNGRGRLYSVSNTQVTTAYKDYDEIGNVRCVSKTITGDATVYTTQYACDLSGKLTRTTYPDGYQVNNTFYPGTGLLEAVTGSDSIVYARHTNYEPTGKIGRIDHANNTFTLHEYDAESTRLLSIVTTNPGPTDDLQNKQYRYTRAGNIKEITDNVKEGLTYTYTYDKLHRLMGETNTGTYAPISYTYNAIGNIMSKTVGTTTMTYSYDAWHKHAVKTITINVNGDDHNYEYEYDDNGNMLKGWDFSDPTQVATRTIAYNADNMPTTISHTKGGNTVTTDYVYGGDGIRAKKVIQSGSTTYYIGAHFEIKDGVATKYIFAGSLRVAKITASTTHYFHKDQLGSSTVMTDAGGVARENTDYMPFGGQRDHSGDNIDNHKFTDQEFDAENGLYNYNARLYDPIIGRFISADPMVQAPFDPQTLNRYSYCRNNPLIYIDPSGYFFSDIVDFFKDLFDDAKDKVVDFIVEKVVAQIVSVVLGYGAETAALAWLNPFLPIVVAVTAKIATNHIMEAIEGDDGGGGSKNPGSQPSGSETASSTQDSSGHNWVKSFQDEYEKALNFYKQDLVRLKENLALNQDKGVITLGFNLTPEEFKAARARTRQLIELLDVATQGLGRVTVAFDIGGAMATHIDIIEAKVPFGNKAEAHFWNAVGLFGVLGHLPYADRVGVGFSIDAWVYYRVNTLLTP